MDELAGKRRSPVRVRQFEDLTLEERRRYFPPDGSLARRRRAAGGAGDDRDLSRVRLRAALRQRTARVLRKSV